MLDLKCLPFSRHLIFNMKQIPIYSKFEIFKLILFIKICVESKTIITFISTSFLSWLFNTILGSNKSRNRILDCVILHKFTSLLNLHTNYFCKWGATHTGLVYGDVCNFKTSNISKTVKFWNTLQEYLFYVENVLETYFVDYFSWYMESS